MPEPHGPDTALETRIRAIEGSVDRLRRDTGRLSAMTMRNRQDLDRALAELDDLLYAALATGRELPPAGAAEQRLGAGPATAAATDRPRCTHPRHAAEGKEPPPASHLMTLEPRDQGAGATATREALPRCLDCANRTLATSAGKRITATPLTQRPRPTQGPVCAAPGHPADLPQAATTVIVTAGARPGIHYCDACARTTEALLTQQRIPYETARIAQVQNPR